MRICQRALQCMVGCCQNSGELLQRICHYIDAARIQPLKCRVASQQMNRSPLSSTRLRKSQRATIKIKSSQHAPVIWRFALVTPVQPAGNHQMEDKPEPFISFWRTLQPKRDPLSHPANLFHLAALRRCDRRIGRAQERRTSNLNALQRMSQHPLLQRFNVNGDVGKFWHLTVYPERSEGTLRLSRRLS